MKEIGDLNDIETCPSYGGSGDSQLYSIMNEYFVRPDQEVVRKHHLEFQIVFDSVDTFFSLMLVLYSHVRM